MQKTILIAIFIWISSVLNAQTLSYLPIDKTDEKGQLIVRDHYVLSFNLKHKQANWVYYKLTPEYIRGYAKRSNDFRGDPVCKGCATLADYRGSGYDRGHLCPAAAMKLNGKAMSETFYVEYVTSEALF